MQYYTGTHTSKQQSLTVHTTTSFPNFLILYRLQALSLLSSHALGYTEEDIFLLLSRIRRYPGFIQRVFTSYTIPIGRFFRDLACFPICLQV